MPKNTTGGSGHKAQRNSEGSKERNNRRLVDTLLDDYLEGEKIEDVFIGRVVRRLGCGRMEVFFVNNDKQGVVMNIPLRGGMRGKGKKSVWVDLDSLVMIAETGLAGATHEIVGVLTDTHIARYKKVYPDADVRLFIKSATAESKMEDETFEFEKECDVEEVNIDAI